MSMASELRSTRDFWTPAWRFVAFMLAASSIWCLLAEFYGLCSMRTFTLFVSIPALVVLLALTVVDRVGGHRQLLRAGLLGSAAGVVGGGGFSCFCLRVFFFQAPCDL